MSTRTHSPIRLSITHSDGAQRTVELSRPLITVGKLSTSTIQVHDVNVSRRHCVIELTARGRWRVTDLGSTNGTLVNGERAVQAVLGDGDVVLVGETRIEVGIGAAGVVVDEGAGGLKLPPLPGAAVEAVPEVRGLGRESFYDKRVETAAGPPVLDVALLWGDTLLCAERFAADRRVRLGESAGCDVSLPAATLGRVHVDLVRPTAQGPVLQLAVPGLSGDVLMDGQLLDAQELGRGSGGRGVLLSEGTKARLHMGEFTVLVGYERAPARPKTSWLERVNLTPLTFIVASAIVHFTFLAMSQLMPEDPLKAMADPDRARQRLVRVMNVTTPPKERPVMEREEPDKVKPQDAQELALEESEVPRLEDTEVANANESLVDKLRKHHQRRAPKSEVLPDGRKLDRKMARQIAKRHGVHAALSKNSSLMSRILKADAEVGTEIAWNGAGSEASEAGLMSETFGPGDDLMSDPGTWLNGPGGDGDGDDNGPLKALSKRTNSRKIDIVDPGPKAKVWKVGPGNYSGTRKRSVVEKKIRRYLSGIRWCLRHDLQAGRAETGRAALKFKISPNGGTFSITVTGAGTSDFRNCARRKVARWRFGAVEMGGVTTITYPVILKIK